MRRSLGIITAVAALTLAACGDRDSASGPAPAGGTPTEATTGPAEFTQVAVLTVSNGGGVGVPAALTRLSTPAEIDKFAGYFNPPLSARIKARASSAQVAEGDALAAGVAYIGCETPTGVRVVHGDSGRLEAEPDVVRSKKQCLVAVTTVGLFTVPADELS